MRHWTASEIAILRKLRECFLSATADGRDYWKSETEIALYDATFGERIGWKWDSVLAELVARNWRPQSRRVLDWGCGSGVAGRRVLAHWPHLDSLALHDRSPLARRFATQRARLEHPHFEISETSEVSPDTLLVLSHVLNELPAAELASLLALARQAHEIIWVEAGTHLDSRRLITEVRETLLPEFAVVAPCTHRAQCGLLAAENAPHWCHHFAAVPSEIFRDGKWAEFARELGIDLRALPYSFLVLERGAPSLQTAGFSRVIGRPREAKGFTRVLSCQAEGVAELILQKRDAPDLFRAFHKGTAESTYRWQIENGRIVQAEPLRQEQTRRGLSDAGDA
jgi:ribosomal protein RSM22 (predicted rRNA methylase)